MTRREIITKLPKRALSKALGTYKTPSGMSVDSLIEKALDQRADEIKNESSKQFRKNNKHSK